MADIIILSSFGWDQEGGGEQQQTALSLAGAGHRVAYVHVFGCRGRQSFLSRPVNVLRSVKRLLHPTRRIDKSLWTADLPRTGVCSASDRPHASRQQAATALSWLCWRLGFRQCVLWTFDPWTMRYLNVDQYASSVYQCVPQDRVSDDVSAAQLVAAEQELSSRVSLVFSSDPVRYRLLAASNQRTYPLHAAIRAEVFGQAIRRDQPCPEALAAIAGPRLLYAGKLDGEELDIDLITSLVARTPQWSYIFMGLSSELAAMHGQAELLDFPNVHLVEQGGAYVPTEWLAHCDAALLPLGISADLSDCLPAAFLEPLAAGLPLVATRLSSFQHYGHAAILCAPSTLEFEQGLAEALAGEGPTPEQRIGTAYPNRYDRRTRRMLALLIQHSLLPLGAPIFERPSLLLGRPPHVKAGFQERLVAKLVSSLVLGLRSLVSPKQAVRLLARMAKTWPDNTLILQSLNFCYLRMGDYSAACAVMEDLWQLSGDLHQIHRLLFRRGARPQQIDHQIALFEKLGAGYRLPFSYRCYSQIVLAYRCIDASRSSQMEVVKHSLAGIASELERDPGTWTCQRENRVNRAKLLVSVYTTMALLSLSLGDYQFFAVVGARASGFADRFDLKSIDSDTSYRITRNLMRCLVIDVLEAWRTNDRRRYILARARLARVRDHSHLECYDSSLAQEDHRGFADDLLAEVDSLADVVDVDSKRSCQIHGLLQLIIKDKRKPVEQIASLFVPYLDLRSLRSHP